MAEYSTASPSISPAAAARVEPQPLLMSLRPAMLRAAKMPMTATVAIVTVCTHAMQILVLNQNTTKDIMSMMVIWCIAGFVCLIVAHLHAKRHFDEDLFVYAMRRASVAFAVAAAADALLLSTYVLMHARDLYIVFAFVLFSLRRELYEMQWGSRAPLTSVAPLDAPSPA